MTAAEIVREVLRREGVSTIELSKMLEKSRGYANRMIYTDNMVSDVFSEMCDALGYDVVVRSREDGAEFFLSPRLR